MKEILTQHLVQASNNGLAKAMALGVVQDGDVVFEHYINANPESLFDVASLTKVISTTTLCAKLVQDGKLDLKAPISEVLKDQAWLGGEACMLGALLRHQAGLAAWHDFRHVPADQKSRVLQGLYMIKDPIGQKTRYSDVGFLILGEVLQAITQRSYLDLYMSLPKVISKNILPWHLIPQSSLDKTIATGNSLHRQSIQGKVFDDNCFYLGGLQPHAGLFATLDSVMSFLDLWLDDTSFLGADTKRLFFEGASAKDGSRRALGWDLPSKDSSAGLAVPPGVVGHLGYTGTSIWMDVSRSIGVVLLTNRTLTRTSQKDFHLFRQQTHDLIWKAMS